VRACDGPVRYSGKAVRCRGMSRHSICWLLRCQLVKLQLLGSFVCMPELAWQGTMRSCQALPLYEQDSACLTGFAPTLQLVGTNADPLTFVLGGATAHHRGTTPFRRCDDMKWELAHRAVSRPDQHTLALHRADARREYAQGF
jgi:hypothetical protein